MMRGRLSDFSQDDLPREKLQRHGRKSLTNAELLAIFLRTGSPGKNVMELASDLIARAGSLEALAKLDVVEIAQLAKGIGKAKSSTLAAAFELGCRAIREEVAKLRLDHPKNIYDLLITETRWVNQETTFVLLVDSDLCLIKKIEVALGSLTEAIVHPRDVFKPAIVNNAYGFILAHNHPSGSVKPSKADDDITLRVLEGAKLMGMKFVDHVIIGKPDADAAGQEPFFSYREQKRFIV